MKKLTKVFLTIAIVAVLVATAVATVIVRGEYYGDLSRVETLLTEVDTKTDFKKLTALEEINTYFQRTPVDPEAEGYGAFVAAYNNKIVSVVAELSALIDTYSTSEEKVSGYSKIYASLVTLSANADIYNKSGEGYEEALGSVIGKTYDIAKSYIDEAAGKKDALQASYDNYITNPEDATLIASLDANYIGFGESMRKMHSLVAKLPSVWEEYTDNIEGFDQTLATLQGCEELEIKVMVADYYNTVLKADQFINSHTAINAAADRLEVGILLSTIDIEASKYSELKSAVDAVREDIGARNAAKMTAVYNKAPINEYEYVGDNYAYGFSDGKIPWTLSSFDNSTGASTGSFVELKNDIYGDSAMAIHYGTQNSAVGGTTHKPESGYINVSAKNTGNGFVLELDIGTDYDTSIKELHVYSYETGKTTGKRMTAATYFKIKNGAFYTFDGVTPLTDKVITPGAYTHIAIAYDAKNLMVEFYVDYELISKASCAQSDTCEVTAFRFASSAEGKGQTILLDNVTGYKGTVPRSEVSISNKSDGEKFKFYAEYAIDTEKDPVFRSEAYEKAAKLYDAYKNSASYKDVADAFAAIDYQSSIFLPAREGCMQVFEELLTRLNETPISTANISSKINEINNIDNYLNSHLSFYNQASEEFLALKVMLNEAKSKVTYTSNLQSLLDAIKRFERADSYAAQYKHMASIKSYFELCELSDSANYESIKNDSKVMEFEAGAGMTIVEYYGTIDAIVMASRATENSARIIACVDFIVNGEYEGGNKYEATEEFWEANYDYINKYVLVIRRIVASGEYDETYKGVDEAVEIYNTMDAYFYELLQREHVEEISAKLSTYLLTDSYIEKLGVCTYIRNFIETEDVDVSREDISALMFTLSVYEKEVEAHADVYEDILNENTQYFIGIANKMLAFNDYTNLNALYTEARTYFYGMNIDSDEAKAAIEIYNECEERLNEMLYHAEAFGAYAARLRNASTRARQYEYLVECYKHLEFIDPAIEGMANALSIYTESANEYNGVRVNAEVETAVTDSVACATRIFSMPASVLAVIKNIFS